MISELDDPTGGGAAAVMTLTGSCSEGGSPSGWYRAYPLDDLGGI